MSSDVDIAAPPPPGLCASCGHVRLVHPHRETRFYLCRRADADPSYPRYPRLPVSTCSGYADAEARG